MSDEEIIAHYKELNKIEDCFRVTKTDLKTRPVFVWTKEHIKAHFLICFVSLVMLRIIQNKLCWKLSVKKIIEALNSAICEELGKGYWKVEASGNLNLINEKLGINWEKRFVNFEEINNYAKGWFTT